MAHSKAPTEPSTLAAALSAHAHRTDGLCHSSSRFSPVGKGIPMTNPAGEIIRTVIAIFSHSGNPTAMGSTDEAMIPSSATRIAIVPRAFTQRTLLSSSTRRLK